MPLSSKLLKDAGLVSCPEMQAITYELTLTEKTKKTNPIRFAEIGSGDGRIAKYLLDHQKTLPPFTYTGFEVNGPFVDKFKQTFNSHPNIEVVRTDILEYTFKKAEKYDIFLLLWCIAYEFKQKERLQLFSLLYQQLTPGGVIICDLPPENLKKSNITKRLDEDTVSIELDQHPKWVGYSVSEKQLNEITEKLTPTPIVKKVPYTTDSGTQRKLVYLFSPSLFNTDTTFKEKTICRK